MARISFEEWKKQNGRNQATGSAVNNNQPIAQPVQSGRMSFEEWKANGRPTFTTARRTAGIAQTNPNNNLRVLSRGFNQSPTISQAVDQFSYNARKAVQSGPINVRDWNKQYEGFMKYLDDYGSQMNGTEVAMLKAKLKNTYDQLNPKKVEIPTYSKLGNLTYDTQNLTTQPRQNMPTYNGGNPFANPSAMAIQNSALGRLNNLANEKIANDARLREDAYMRGIGASNNANTDRELQVLQNLYKNAQESRYKQTGTLGNYGPNAVETPVYKDLRAAGETYDPTRSNPAAPGKDDGEDFWQKYERIQREHPEFTEDQIYDYIENEPRANYTPVQKSPLADDSIFTRANNAINTELENRSFLREYAPNYLNADFKENSKYNNQFGWQGAVPEVGTQAARGPLGGSLTDDEYARMFYESVNGNQAATDYLTKVKDPETGELLEYDYGQQRYMYDGKNKSVLAEALQDDERGMFNYLYATQGADSAMKYYEGLLPALNQRWTAAYNEELQEKMKDPGLAILYNAFTTATKPITAIASVANQVYDLAKNGKIDANDPKYAMLNGANLVRAATSKAINNDVLSFLYEGAMSTIDNIYGTMLGSKIADVFGIAGNAANKVTEGIVLGLMTTDAAQASVLSNIQSGMDTTSAITNGLMSGAIEFITEKIGLDNFFNSMWYGKEKWVSLAKQILSEGGEEVVGNTMDDAWGMLYDRLTGLSTSDWRREMNAYILENGLAPDDELTAFNAVFEQHLLDTAKAGLMGGFSGGIMGGFGMGRGAVELNNQIGNIMPANISFSSADSSIPANIRLADIDQVQGLIEEGLSYDPSTKAYKKAAKLQTMLDTGRVTDSQAIDLYKELVKADVTNESHAAPELSSIDRSSETRPQTAFPMQGPSVNVPAATAQKFIPQELYLSAVAEATNQDNTTTGEIGIDANEAETLIGEVFNEGLTGEMNPEVNARAQKFIGPEYTEAIRQAGVQARDTNRRTAFGPTFNMPAQEMVQRDQLIEDVAAGYDSAGRTSMGEVMRAFNPFKNHAVTDMSTADYVSEISAVYNAAAQNQEIPPTPHLTQQAAQAAINAARMDSIYLNEGITSAEQAEMEAPEETNAAVKPAEYTPVEKTAEQRDTDYDYIQDYAGEVAKADGQGKFGIAVVNNYYDDMDANAYTSGAQAILEQAQQGVPLEDVTLPAQAQKFISPQLKAELYNAVNTQEALGNAANTQEVTNGTEERNVPVHESGERINSQSPAVQGGAVAEGTGRTESTGRVTEGRRQGENIVPAENAEPAGTRTGRTDAGNLFHPTGRIVTAQSLGIKDGTAAGRVEAVELTDNEQTQQIRAIEKQYGVEVVPFAGGDLTFKDGTTARGVYENGKLYVRMDDTQFTPAQIARHEAGHHLLRNNANNKINRVLEAIARKFGDRFVSDELLPSYRDMLRRANYGDLQIKEEIVCDLFGGMNLQTEQLRDLPAMEGLYDRFMEEGGKISQDVLNRKEEENTETTDSKMPKYSLVGFNVSGIEVYETSDAVKNVPIKERKRQYLDLLKNDYVGRTARFVRNGHVYYAEFDRKSLDKPIYGERHNTAGGYKALIRTGADGSIFDLVENSTYNGSAKDTKGHNNKDHFTEYFDYFVKTVQIDGKVYDLSASIKKKYGEADGYTYTLFLRENHNIKASPATVPKSGSFKMQATPTDKITQDQNTGKPKRSLSLESTIVDSEGNQLTASQAEFFEDSKIRDEDGNLQVVYHGTSENFTVFDRSRGRANMDIQGSFFSPWELDAQGYGDNVRAYYLNITNPAPEGVAYKALNRFKGQNNAGVKAREYLESLGYDGVNNSDEEYIAFYPEQIKLVSNQIPTENPDIRYSQTTDQRSSIATKTQEDVAADLKKRVTQLEKKAEYFKGQTELSALTPGSAAWKNMKPLINEYGARKILRAVQDFYGSTADIKGMVPEIQRLVTLLATRPDANTFDDVNHLILPIAKQLIENTQVIIEDDGSEILKDIRKTTIKVSPRTQADIADYNKWRMSHFGKMNLSTNKGTDVTEYYNELTEKFGEAAFPSDINTATDQLLYIADFVDNYQPVTQNPYSYDMAALTQDAALTLYNEMLNADLFKPTYADRQNARIEKLQQESAERVQEVRRQARQQRDDQIQKIKDHAKDVAARRRARKEEQTARQKLIRLARRLNSMKTTKANRALIEELIGNLDTVAYSLTEGKAANLMELNAWYETQKETNPDFVAHADLVQKQLARLTQQHIADMTVDEILDLTKSLMTLENDIRTQNKLINTKMNEDALQAGIKAIRDIDNARGIDKGLRRTIDNLIVQGTLSPTRFMHRLTGYNDSDPLYQAVAGEDGLAGGQRKMLDYQYRAGKLFEEWLSDRKFTRWFTGTKAEILSYDIVTADGQQRTIQMTPAMRTTLYLAAKDKGWMQHMCGRDTMDGHIAGGGIVLPDIKSYRKGNISDAYDSGTVKVKITKSFLDKLAQDMTEQELKFAEAIHDYFNGMSKNEINAVSELLLGRSIAEVGDYLPISVDKNFLGAEYGAIKYDGTIEGMGNLKERQASKKPVIVRDITDILKQSIESTSKYVGLAIPIRNFNKIMGVTVGHTDENKVYQNFEGSVLESIANKWGKKAQTYIENMISDLQMPNNSQEDLEKMFAKIRSKYAGAVLTLNASVALKQAASYPTAAAVLGWGPLLKAFKNTGHVDLNFIAKWTPLQWYRTKGFSTTELGDIQNQNNIFANMPKGLNWIQGMDLITTRKLWKAAEYYVRDNNPELYKPGAGERGQSDAFYRAVADIYNKTIEETQPNYTALQRPELLRSKSGLVRTLMMFKTQPMQNFNVIYDAVGDFQAKRAQYRNNADSAEAQQAYEESGKRLRRAVTSQIGQLITFAAMTMLWNMFRRKKEKYTDEEGNVSLEKIAESMGKDIGSGVFGMVPFGSEVWSFISSKIFGDKYYGFESVTDSAISDFLNAGSSAWELIGKIIEDDEPFNITTYKKKLKTVLSSASKIMGVPFDNLYNTVTAGYMRGRDMVDGLFHGNKNLADYWALSWTEDASKDKAEFFDILYNAHMDGNEGEYEEILQLMIDSGEYGDKPEETIADGLQDTFIKHTTHVKGETDSTAKYKLYDYMYKHQDDEKLHEDALFFGFTEDDIEKGIRNSLAAELIGVPSNEFNKDGLYGHLYSIFDTPEYKTKHDTLTANGWTEDEITDGLKKAYGVQLTGIDSSDYKNADLFTYLYDMKQTNSAGYTAATKEMKKIGYTDDNITDGMKKAYGMQVTGVTEEYSTAVLFDYLYDLKKNHVSNYNAELTKMKGVGFTDKNINDGMKDAYGRAVTGLGSDYTTEALYTTVYKNNKSSLSGKVSEMKGFGFSEQSIRDGLKQAYGASATGIAYQTVKMDDVYDYIYGLYSNNSNRFSTEYQAMLNVGFTEKAIKDGIEARMKEAYGVDNVKKLPHRFVAPDHTLPSYWTYKNDEKDTGPLKEEGYANGSSWISNISYNNGELTVYEHGKPYTYHGVSEEAYENFKAGGFRGSALNAYIKGRYSYN